MLPDAPITGSLVRLRRMRPEDAADRLRWLRDPAVFHAASQWQLSTVAEADWIENQLEAPEGHFEIDTLKGRHIGTTALVVDAHHCRAELSIHIGEQDCWGKGYGREAMTLLLRYGFENRGLHRIGLHVRASNTRAITLYEELGFVHEGAAREAVRLEDGSYEDTLAMAMLEDDWRRTR